MLVRRALIRAPAAATRPNVSSALPIRTLTSQAPALVLESTRLTTAVTSLTKAPVFAISGRAFSTSFRLSAVTRAKTTRKSKSRKAAPKKKKPKKTAAKKKPVKKAKKPKKALTESEKISQKVRELKKTALIAEEPRGGAGSSYALFISDRSTKGTNAVANAKNLSQEWRSLPESEKQRYGQLAEQNATSAKRSVSAWVASKTPDEIRKANNARQQLKRIKSKPLPPGRSMSFISSVPPKLADPRQPTRPKTAFFLFAEERRASGDFTNLPVTETTTQLGREWRNLSESEKSKYYETHARNAEKYRRDYATAFPNAPASRSGQ